MGQRSYSKRHKIKIYRRPEMVLLFITVFLWLAFLFKVFFVKEANDPVEKLNLSTHVTNTPNKLPNQNARLAPAKSRNKNAFFAPENQAVVEAVRESFERENPAKNNQIIRGEIMESPKPVEDLSEDILKMLNDNAGLKSLNKDYKEALKNKEK